MIRIIVFLIFLLSSPILGNTATITLEAVDTGFYSVNGLTTRPGGTNYLTGRCSICQGNIHRGFFTFNLSGIVGTIIDAQLEIFNPRFGSNSPDTFETLGIFDVVTPIPTLLAGNLSDRPSIYSDLGSGVLYGTKNVSEADENSLISIPLNSDALSDLNSNTGIFAFGSHLLTLSSLGPNQFVFGFSQGSDTQRLILETEAPTTAIPEPSSLFSLTLALIGLRLRKAIPILRSLK